MPFQVQMLMDYRLPGYLNVWQPTSSFSFFNIFFFFQRVGCDLRIGSTKRVDECGVCGGDGSCAQPLYHWVETPASLCSATCGGGKSRVVIVKSESHQILNIASWKTGREALGSRNDDPFRVIWNIFIEREEREGFSRKRYRRCKV